MPDTVTRAPREYVILERTDVDIEPDDPFVAWRVITAVKARGRAAALAAAVGDRAGTFKAVGAKAWDGGVQQTVEEKPVVTATPLPSER